MNTSMHDYHKINEYVFDNYFHHNVSNNITAQVDNLSENIKLNHKCRNHQCLCTRYTYPLNIFAYIDARKENI